MMKQSSFRLGKRTTEQLHELADHYGTQTTAIRIAVDRLWQREIGNERQMWLEHEAEQRALDAERELEAMKRDLAAHDAQSERGIGVSVCKTLH